MNGWWMMMNGWWMDEWRVSSRSQWLLYTTLAWIACSSRAWTLPKQPVRHDRRVHLTQTVWSQVTKGKKFHWLWRTRHLCAFAPVVGSPAEKKISQWLTGSGRTASTPSLRNLILRVQGLSFQQSRWIVTLKLGKTKVWRFTSSTQIWNQDQEQLDPNCSKVRWSLLTFLYALLALSVVPTTCNRT